MDAHPLLLLPPQGEELLGSREDGGAGPARCVVVEVQQPQPAAAAAPVAGDDDATDDENTGKVALKAPVVDPDSILYSVEWLGEGGEPSGVRATLRRPQLQRGEGSPVAALAQPLLARWVATVATAEPVAVRLPLDLLLLPGWPKFTLMHSNRAAGRTFIL